MLLNNLRTVYYLACLKNHHLYQQFDFIDLIKAFANNDNVLQHFLLFLYKEYICYDSAKMRLTF